MTLEAPMTSSSADPGLATLLRGMVLGFSIAAPVGPIGVLCIRRTLNGHRVGQGEQAGRGERAAGGKP